MTKDNNLPINIILPDSFLDDEIRCDYKINSYQKRIWAIQLDMYKTISRVCNKYGIKFFVAFGSLLGAIRHKGFIPWDDDFDICMNRKDYERFCALPQEEFGEPYFLQTALSDRKYWIPMARFRNSQTTGAIAGMMSNEYNNGIYIDIYPMDGLIENKILRSVHSFLVHLALQPVASYYMKNFPHGIQGVIKKSFRLFSQVLSYEFWQKLYVFIVSFPTKKCKKIAIICDYSHYLMKQWLFRNEIVDIENHSFEFTEVPVPSAFDKILKRTYGDYMKFPPIEKRGVWHEGQLILDPDVPYKDYFLQHGIND